MRIRRALVAGLALGAALPVVAASPAHAARLQVSGVLGQSEPPGAEPLPFIGAIGAITDGKGRIWTAAGSQLFVFAAGPGGRWRCVARHELPGGVSTLGLRWDGERLCVAGGDGTVSALSVEGTPAVRARFRLGPGARSFAVAPAGLRRGWALHAKCVVLVDDRVETLGSDGAPSGHTLNLTRPRDAAWRYCAVGIEPVTGDLLVGSEWPDSKVYRCAPNGEQVTLGGWPRAGHAAHLFALGAQAWMLELSGVARRLPARQMRTEADTPFGGLGCMYPTGLARDGVGGFWLASSQGLVRFDRRGRPTGERLGGITGVRSLGVATDGTVVATVEGGQRVLRLGLDDACGAPLSCNANEPWRVAGGWTNRASALAWGGGLFAVLDATARQVWHFDPWHTGWQERPWLKLTEPGSLVNPRALAAGDSLLWVLDGGRILELQHGAWDRPVEARLSELPEADRIICLAACEDDALLVAWPDRIHAYRRLANGEYSLRWRAEPFGEITGVAATRQHVLVADTRNQEVVALEADTGRLVARLTAAQVPGGMVPGAIAASGRWVVVADEPGKRLLRLRLRDE